MEISFDRFRVDYKTDIHHFYQTCSREEGEKLMQMEEVTDEIVKQYSKYTVQQVNDFGWFILNAEDGQNINYPLLTSYFWNGIWCKSFSVEVLSNERGLGKFARFHTDLLSFGIEIKATISLTATPKELKIIINN